jgi:hypothetical protein
MIRADNIMLSENFMFSDNMLFDNMLSYFFLLKTSHTRSQIRNRMNPSDSATPNENKAWIR